MAALYVPVANPDVLMVTVMGSVSVVVVPEVVLRFNQAALSLTVHESVPLPVFVRLTIFPAGLPAP